MMKNRKVQIAILSFIPVLLIVGTFILITLDPHEEEVVQEVVVPEVVVEPKSFVSREVIGSSVEGREIEVMTFGEGETHLLFVGGVHGGYEWNGSLLAYGMIEHIEQNPEFVPENVRVSIIPSLNPDGLYMVTGTEGVFTVANVPDTSVRVPEGRFNANGVDLNRNFDCKWAPESTWRGNVVSAGTEAFSEPEAAALRDYVATIQPAAVAFWHSKANNVYASECEAGVLPDTLTLMDTYATAGSYGAVPSFDAYPITGDAEGWLASVGIPAVTVELETHDSIEWERNIAGVEAVLELYTLTK
ncbi:MAG: hypothetical protein ACI92I_000715 [Acidimicrobiales bacterium]|jgi:hypothetical protein